MARTPLALCALALAPLVACSGTQSSAEIHPPGYAAPLHDVDLSDPDQPLTLCFGEVDPWGPAAQTGASGKDEVPGYPVRLTLRSGEWIEGRLLEATETRILIATRDDETRAILMTALVPASAYTVRRHGVALRDVQGQLDLARFATEVKRWPHAAHHYKVAASRGGDASMDAAEGLALLRQVAAEAELARAREALEKDRVSFARAACVRILRELPDEAACREAALIVARIEANRAARREAERLSGDPSTMRQLARAGDRLDRALEAELEGFRRCANPTAARRSFDKALAFALDAADEIETTLGRHDLTEDLRRAAQRLEVDVDRVRVDQELNLASIALIRGDFTAARERLTAAMRGVTDPRLNRMRDRVRFAEKDPHWHRWYLSEDGPTALESR